MVPPYFRCSTFHACETRNNRHVIHLGAMADVVLQPGRALRPRIEPVERVGPGRSKPPRGDRSTRPLPADRVDDPAGAVRVVERERPFEPGADDGDVTALAARRLRDR